MARVAQAAAAAAARVARVTRATRAHGRSPYGVGVGGGIGEGGQALVSCAGNRAIAEPPRHEKPRRVTSRLASRAERV
eukprot:scaffold8836_cov62-Phaeocystis_antarctica.AAC.9